MNWLQRHIQPEQVRELILLLLIVVAITAFASVIPNYFTPRTFDRIASSVVIIAVAAIGQTLVVVTRNIDLSVGSLVGGAAYFAGTIAGLDKGLPPVAVVMVAVALGVAGGALNGLLVTLGRIPSIIVTLGTLAIYRGVLVDLSGAKTVTTDSLPQWIVDLPHTTVFSLGRLDFTVSIVLMLGMVAIAQLVITRLNFGRRFYAIGSNPDAAQLIGMPIRRTLFIAFVLSGALAGLAGFLTLARFGTITVDNARGLELQVVAAVVVGGVNIFGGSGTVVGATLGAILIGTLEQSLYRLDISEFWRDALLGLLILLAVASDAVILERLRALWARTELKLLDKKPVARGRPS